MPFTRCSHQLVQTLIVKVSLESALIRVELHGTHMKPPQSRLQQPRLGETDAMGSFLLVTLRKTGLVLGELGQSSVGDFSMLQVRIGSRSPVKSKTSRATSQEHCHQLLLQLQRQRR